MATDLRFDHAVIAVPALDKAMADYQALGFTVRFGGEHPGRRTHNALITFADGSYLELIAERPQLPPTADARENWVREALAEGRAFLTFALRSESLTATIAECDARGLTLTGPMAGARARPDGQWIAWRSAAAAARHLPFIIEDVSARNLRISEAAADTAHANGVKGARRVVLLAGDVSARAAEFAALLGMAAAWRDGAALFAPGDTEICLRPPANAAEEMALGAAPAIPQSLVLAAGAARELDERRSGFPISLTP